MRVLMLNPSFSGGGYVHNLCNALVEQGNDVELATSPHFLRSSRGWGKVSYTPRIWFYRWTQLRSYARGPLRPFWQLLRLLSHNWTMWRIVRLAPRFDIVHAHFPSVLILDVPWLRIISRRTVLVHTVHNLYPHDAVRSPRKRRLLRRLYRACDTLLVHTDATREGLITDFGISPERVIKVPFGSYSHMVSAITSRDHSAVSSNDVPTVLLFGEIRFNKGVDILIEAAALLRDRGVRFRVVLAGQPGAPADSYRDQAQRLGLVGTVEFRVGYIEEERVATVFSDAAIVALPYTAIDHSAVAITATTLGRPIVASNLAGLAELVNDAKNGLLVPPGDPAALADALELLLHDETMRRRFERNSREYAQRALSWTPIGQHTAAIYQSTRAQRIKGSNGRPQPRSS